MTDIITLTNPQPVLRGEVSTLIDNLNRLKSDKGMPVYKFSKRSRNVLDKIHPDLRAAAHVALASSPTDIGIYHGRRTWQEQMAMIEKKTSMTRNSRHLSGHAIDLYPYIAGTAIWKREAFLPIKAAFDYANNILDFIKDGAIEWGGDWQSFQDCPHFQLSWGDYPHDDIYQPPPLTADIDKFFTERGL